MKTKDLALGGQGKTEACTKPKCKLCKMICDRSELKVNNIKVRSAKGSCSSYNVIYMFLCNICNKPYVGRTVSQLNIRTNQHRSAFYKVLEQSKTSIDQNDEFTSEEDDIYSLGVHLVNDHGCTNRTDFNNTYQVLILENSSPKTIDIKEHKIIKAARNK